MKGTTVLCFDFGLKRIGIAVGQTATNSGRPLTTISANSGIPDGGALKRVLNEWQPELIDEAYTTLAANNALAEQGIKAHNRTALRDQYAALEILNTWMNEQTIQRTKHPD